MLGRLLAALALSGLSGAAGAADTLAVWDFDNNTVGPMATIQAVQPLATLLPDSLTSALSAFPELRVVERTKLRQVLEEQKLGSSALADQDSKLRLGRILGARGMIFGNYVELGGVVRADVRLVDVETGQVLLSTPIIAPSDRLQDQVGELAARIDTLYILHDSGLSAEAQSLYRQGLDALKTRQFDAAVSDFKQILEQYPEFKPAERLLGQALEDQARSP